MRGKIERPRQSPAGAIFAEAMKGYGWAGGTLGVLPNSSRMSRTSGDCVPAFAASPTVLPGKALYELPERRRIVGLRALSETLLS